MAVLKERGGQASKNKWKAKVSALEAKLSKSMEQDEGPSIAEIQACIAAVAPTTDKPVSTPSDPTYQA